jgi:multidrug transporter EmrE-like cation transporter
MPGLPVRTPTEALLTIAPLPCRAICRSSCFMQLQTPRKLIPITRSQSSPVLSAVGTRAVPIVGVLAAAIMLGEPLGIRQAIAMALTLAGVALATI